MEDSQTESGESRFVVGIDLGTTNSAVCFIDTQSAGRTIQVLGIPQLIDAGEVESLETLPSFLYEPADGEFAQRMLRLPWSEETESCFVGQFARDHGVQVPGRVVASAKSWLCHAGIDREAAILPWHGSPDVELRSPVEVSSQYLLHISRAWRHRFPDAPLSSQEVVLTIPASFDEVARELTIRAARLAGLTRIQLIEEPQAAFYSWIDQHAQDWESRVQPGQRILVCDVGGGTTDFTLIHVRSADDGSIQFHRVAVGEHLILGGDNLDLALAQYVERRLAAEQQLEQLNPQQWSSLVRLCRQFKERFLGEEAPETLTLTIPGRGSRLLGGGIQIELSREDVRRELLQGFLPVTEWGERPQQQQSGFREFGLPYAADAAITRYLAEFLAEHDRAAEGAAGEARPDIVLFNGGLFDSPLCQRRILETLRHWFAGGTDWEPLLLQNPRLDLAVARGAAYYGLVRRGQAVRIHAGLARTYYLGVATGPARGDGLPALCVAPAGTEPGVELVLENQRFELRVSEPVQFPLFVSSTRTTDSLGDLVQVEPEQFRSLPAMRTVLKTRARDQPTVPVTLHARLSEIGTLDLWCASAADNRSWRLQFDVRTATRTDVAAHESQLEQQGVVSSDVVRGAREIVSRVFSEHGDVAPKDAMSALSDVIGMDRQQWPTTLMRELWDALIGCESGRRLSAPHEARWLNLLGFVLRPGFGVALDDWRVSETWKLLQNRVLHDVPQCQSELLIMWRRISGGLTRGQQIELSNPLLVRVRQAGSQASGKAAARGRKKRAGGGLNPQEFSESWRLLGALELLPVAVKCRTGDLILQHVKRGRELTPVLSAELWALGRLGCRQPVYGPLNGVIPPERVSAWLDLLIKSRLSGPETFLAAMQLARRTDDRFRDISQSMRTQVLRWLSSCDAPAHLVELVEHGGTLGASEQQQVLGDELPIGLTIR